MAISWEMTKPQGIEHLLTTRTTFIAIEDPVVGPKVSLDIFLLLARYIPNVAKRSIWDKCKKKYILRTDRSTNNRPTSYLEKFQMAISPRGVIWSTHVWGFTVGFSGSVDRMAQLALFPVLPNQRWRSWKIQMAISLWRIIRFTTCLVLEWGFRGRRIEWCYFQFEVCGKNNARGVIRLVTI